MTDMRAWSGGDCDASDMGACAHPSALQRIDPRVRVVAAGVFAAVAVSMRDLSLAAAMLGLAAGLAGAARLPLGRTLRRTLAMDAFVAFLLVTLPFTTPGEALFGWGGMNASREGLTHAVLIATKAYAVVLALLALVGTMESTALGHALLHLGVSAKFVHQLLFTVRYVAVLDHEYKRLRLAMKARAFRPRANLHSWGTFGYLFGMLLVRSFDRAERILAAMKCRGFDGRFHTVEHTPIRRHDWAFAATLALALAAVAWAGAAA